MTTAQALDQVISAAEQLSLSDIRRLLDALVVPLRDLDVCTGNYVARAAQAICDRRSDPISGTPAPQ